MPMSNCRGRYGNGHPKTEALIGSAPNPIGFVCKENPFLGDYEV